MAWTTKYGTVNIDFMYSTRYDDVLLGGSSDDILVDGGKRGQTDLDSYQGGNGNDRIYSHWGVDYLSGGEGHDHLISRSDAGEPAIGQNPLLPNVSGPSIAASNDRMNGGLGNDVFQFVLEENARPEIIAKHIDLAGNIDWDGIGTESTSPHDHWIEGIGTDTIEDFFRSEGDSIVIEAHSVVADIAYADTNRDGRNDVSIITLRSDTGGVGAHDKDMLGTIRVFGDLVTAADLQFTSHDLAGHMGPRGSIDDHFSWTNVVGTAGNDTLRTTATDGRLTGWAGNDLLIDGSTKGDADRDSFIGGDGNDVIRTRWGNDVLNGGNGDDILVSRCDAGEPEIAQATTLTKVYAAEPFLMSSDVMTGGLGADTFYFRIDVGARLKIIAKHTDDSGMIDWHGVTGENNRVHDHWVESIGSDTITDFYRAEGDQIKIEGHTVQVKFITYVDTNKDGRSDYSLITLRSQQGRAGAHDEDIVGHIKVYGDKVLWSDVLVTQPAHGLADNIDDLMIL